MNRQRCRIVIIGGGFAGASLAIQLVRRAPGALEIMIVEPRSEVGRGLAYSTKDPDHRLNAPAFAHSLLPEDFLHFSRWAEDRDLLARDPDALHADGGVYFRRYDFGTYLVETLAEHSTVGATGSQITHLRDLAVSVGFENGFAFVRTQSGQEFVADRVVIATGNPSLRLPKSIIRPWPEHAGLIENPFEPGRLKTLAPAAEILVVGAGLTALDAMSTLLAQGHRGTITAVSRHGLTPRGQGPIPPALRHGATPQLPGQMFHARLTGAIPAFLDSANGVPPKALAWLRALRRQIAEATAGGGAWQQPFDSLRDSLWRLWPSLPLSEQRRVLRHLRKMYDVHRFRTPPQSEATAAAAGARGQVRYATGTVVELRDAGRRLSVAIRRPGGATAPGLIVDAVVNASGLDTAAGIATNPVLRALCEAGHVQIDAHNLGLSIDDEGRAIDVDGKSSNWLRIIGPPTLGSFGDPIGAFFVAAQIHRFIPSILAGLTGA